MGHLESPFDHVKKAEVPRADRGILMGHLESLPKNTHRPALFLVDPSAYRAMSMIVTQWVQKRLFLEDLSRNSSLASVEVYRLFAAAQENLKFISLSEIIRSVVLFGDVLPDQKELDVHPFTRKLLRVLTNVCKPFFERIHGTRGEALVDLGKQWVQELCSALCMYLPPRADRSGAMKNKENVSPLLGPEEGFGQKAENPDPSEDIPPLDKPGRPMLNEPRNLIENILSSIRPGQQANDNKESLAPREQAAMQRIQKVIRDFAAVVTRASAQTETWQDMRYDVLESVIRRAPFSNGPIEGNPTDGHEISISLGDNQIASEQIFDRAIELSDDHQLLEELLETSRPIKETLRRSLYPNIEQVPEMQRLRTGGSIDPARLPLADFSSTIYRRYRIVEKADRRGRPVLVIACDGSGSLKPSQMKMLKSLAASWLTSTAKSEVQILAGLYTSGDIRRGLSEPLVQWIYHPKKTPAASQVDAVRALVTLPDNGKGKQSDALSIAFIMEEARRIARGNMIYLILLTDTVWNRSFNTPKTGYEEVSAYFHKAYDEFAGKLHTTLVALGVSKKTGLEDILDAVITVSKEDLNNYSEVAEKIGAYVASCIRERSRLISAN
jgi:hypothetical protein